MSTIPPSVQDSAEALSSAGFARWVEQLANVDTNAGDAEMIDQISQLERLKAACAAAQASLTVAFVASQVEGLTAAKARDEHAHRSIAAQVALARKESPVRGNRLVGLAKSLIREMPSAFAALRAGEISEWRATLLVRETACLSAEHRRQVDAELAGLLDGLGDKAVAQAAARIAQRIDPASVVARNRKAVSERRVSLRPAPDTMTYLSALLPVAQGVAVLAALTRHADAAKATGDPRGRGQLMADELVTRTTAPAAAGSAQADSTANTSDLHGSVTDALATVVGVATEGAADSGETGPTATPDPFAVPEIPAGLGLDIRLVMTDRTLFDGDCEPAHLVGYGPIPAALARRLVRDAAPQTKAWIRRLFSDPNTGHLITGDTRRRDFNYSQRQFLIARDQVCRMPYCDATTD